jgi:hypothetical protein
LNLKVLNESKPNVLHYLPYGVTTLEMQVERDVEEVLDLDCIYPKRRGTDRDKNLFVGFADQSEDFLILWGGGSERGLKVSDDNVNGRLFFQILHRGNITTDTQSITLCHSGSDMPITTIKLVPAEDYTNLIRMNMCPAKEGSEFHIISFKGSKVPLYYPRWFPPRPSENKKIEYSEIDVPNIKIKFKVKESAFIAQVDSDIDIFLNDDPNPIARISEDWRYSSLHAELFTIFGDSDYLILRLWCYWVNANFSFGGSINIECPDYERFDFLIEMKKKKVTYVGTDFHYQEWWYKIDDGEDFTRAKIAGGLWTIERTLMGLKERFNTKENFDPMTLLKVMLRQETTAMSPMKILREYIQSNRSKMGPNKAAGFFGKHIPYPENGRPVADLVSSVATS